MGRGYGPRLRRSPTGRACRLYCIGGGGGGGGGGNKRAGERLRASAT